MTNTATLKREGTLDKEISSASLGQEIRPILSVIGLSKSFNNIQIFNKVSFEVLRKKAFALIGPNGVGKSTLLRCCIRLIEPDSGEINLFGKEITRVNEKELRYIRTRVGFVFQRHNLIPKLSVISNVIQGSLSKRRGPRAWFHSLAPNIEREKAMDYLNMLGIAHLAEHLVENLSVGQSQRVAITRVLMQEPELIIADEPVASLDPKAGEEVMNLFVELTKKEGITLLFSSHNLKHALQYSDHLLGLQKGGLTINSSTNNLCLSDLKGIYDG
ncbi:MAG: ATP-binding cassette domain-containing protein [Candidatus Methanosuratincola sp.]|jgi:phosphonate transport system ATP-binding protein